MLKTEELYKRIEEIDAELSAEYKDGETNWTANLECERERLENAICILEDLSNYTTETGVSEIIVSDITWDTDEEDVELPETVTIPITLDNIDLLEDIEEAAEGVCNYLSDTYEFCVFGFTACCK